MPRKSNPELVSKLVDKVWPDAVSEKGGQEHYVVCPFCDADKSKCAINPTKGVFQCWVCQEKGPIMKLLIHLRKLGLIAQTDIEAIKTNKPALSDKIKSLVVKEEPEHKVYWSSHRPCVFPPKVFPLYDWVPKGTIEGRVKKAALSYLKKRSIPDEFIEKFRIHACANMGSKYHTHLFFPVMGKHGRQMKYWTTRVPGKGTPKSLHASSSYSAYRVKTILVNEHLLAPRKEDTVILCEGPFDAFSLYHILGIPACPLFGKHLHSFARNQLEFHGIKNVTVCLDEDAKTEARKLANRLSGDGFDVKLMLVKGGDPNDVSPEELKKFYKEATTDWRGVYEKAKQRRF